MRQSNNQSVSNLFWFLARLTYVGLLFYLIAGAQAQMQARETVSPRRRDKLHMYEDNSYGQMRALFDTSILEKEAVTHENIAKSFLLADAAAQRDAPELVRNYANAAIIYNEDKVKFFHVLRAEKVRAVSPQKFAELTQGRAGRGFFADDGRVYFKSGISPAEIHGLVIGSDNVLRHSPDSLCPNPDPQCVGLPYYSTIDDECKFFGEDLKETLEQGMKELKKAKNIALKAKRNELKHPTGKNGLKSKEQTILNEAEAAVASYLPTTGMSNRITRIEDIMQDANFYIHVLEDVGGQDYMNFITLVQELTDRPEPIEKASSNKYARLVEKIENDQGSIRIYFKQTILLIRDGVDTRLQSIRINLNELSKEKREIFLEELHINRLLDLVEKIEEVYAMAANNISKLYAGIRGLITQSVAEKYFKPVLEAEEADQKQCPIVSLKP